MRVTISYFKPVSGKWKYTDQDVEWPRDSGHYDGWAPFEQVVRLKDLIAVCMDAPMGYPQMYVPTSAT